MRLNSVMRVCLVIIAVSMFAGKSAAAVSLSPGYAVITKASVAADKEWGPVIKLLLKKYPDTKLYTYTETPFDVLDKLKADRPRYMALVLPPPQIGKDTVVTMHQLSRKLDDDPYGDCLWGIITGYTAEDAMRIVRTKKPLEIKSAFGTTGFRTKAMVNVLNISDSTRGEVFMIEDGGQPQKTKHDSASAEGLTPLLENFWSEKEPELFVTSGHATQYNLEISWGQGLITCYANRFYALRHDQLKEFARFLHGIVFDGNEQDLVDYIQKCQAPALKISTSPKVWVGAGNCLLGDVNRSRNTMAVTALSAGGFNQLVGYTVTTWFGRMGWGTLGKFQGPQHITLAEAFFMSNQSILDECVQQYPQLLKMNINPYDNFFELIRTPEFHDQAKSAGIEKFKKESFGLLHDRDTVAFYGDPRWEARMPGAAAIRVKSKPIKGGVELQISTTDKFKAGSGFISLFPVSIKNPHLNGGDGWDLLLTDDFVVVKSSDLIPDAVKTIQVLAEGEGAEGGKN